MLQNNQRLINVGSTGVVARVGLAAAVLLAMVFVYFAVSWQFANMLADVTKPTDANAEWVSDTAIGLSSRDPLVQWLKAIVDQDRSSSDFAGFERVVRLSPFDYRWWGQLGRAYEQADKIENAEKAFEYANILAPNYVVPKWQTGNFYLRLGREEEAIKNLKDAVARDPVYREQVFSIVWDFYEKDSAKLETLVDNDPAVIAGLAKFYAAKGLPSKSLSAWNRLSKADRDTHSEVAELIAQAMFDKGFFATSVKLRDQLGFEKGAAVGKIHNGGFESDLVSAENALFAWKISRLDGMRVQTTGFKKRGGKQSLAVSFSGFNKPNINNIYQTIAVENGAKYRIEFSVKTERLASSGLPVLQVTNAIDSKVLATSKPFSAGSNEWENYELEFLVPDDSEGVSIRTSREYCGEECVLTGSFWYDDFKLEQLD